MTNTCSICDKKTDRLLECNVCGEEVCPSCMEQCSECGRWACHRHIICVYKGTYLCNDCYENRLKSD